MNRTTSPGEYEKPVIVDEQTRIPMKTVIAIIIVCCVGFGAYMSVRYQLNIVDWRLSRIEDKLGIVPKAPSAQSGNTALASAP